MQTSKLDSSSSKILVNAERIDVKSSGKRGVRAPRTWLAEIVVQLARILMDLRLMRQQEMGANVD